MIRHCVFVRFKSTVTASERNSIYDDLRALKQHGMVLADNGSSWFMSGAPDPGWNNDDLAKLRTIPGSGKSSKLFR